MTKHAADRVAEVPMAPPAPAGGPVLGTATGGPATAGEVLSAYLHTQAGDFLRSLRLHGESGADVEEAAEAARLLRRAARRISGALSVYRPITDTAWSDQLRAELAWLSGTLALEHAYAGRLARLRDALHRLSGAGGPPPRTPPGDAASGEPAATGVDPEAVGASGSTTVAARTARGGATAGIDGGPGAAPRSSRTARRSVSLAAGAPDSSPRATRGGAGPEEAVEAGGRNPRARSAASGAPDRDVEAPRRPYEGSEEWGDTAPPEATDGAGGTSAGGTRGPGAEERTSPHQRAGDPEEARGGALTVGAARAGALLERQLTLAKTRAHTAALQALGSSRFHAVADTVALLASEVPLDETTAGRPAEQVLPPLAELANRRLMEAVEALPLGRAGHPYNAEALVHGLAATATADAPPASDRQDAPWHQVRRLVRMRRYALEVLDLMAAAPAPADAEPSTATRLQAAGQALERHRDAAEAAAAAAAAARTPRIAPATAYALGVLHADQRHEVEAARFAFGRMWRRVAGQAS
ncbi:CHAD domain-containing protein [Streptomyces sp. NPDC021212]|uniref:CHAD domain-containing protein n=1 Tax=Streptomyces sp. NPDC021212 TaxID=3365118 RepID=UPI0037B023D1